MLNEAFSLANAAHAGQTKANTRRPYLYHPLAVAALVMKYRGTETQVAAALLHDALDRNGLTLSTISEKLGPEVATYVDAFTDPPRATGLAPGWTEIRKDYLAKVAQLPQDTCFLIACEELHEIQELLYDLRYHPLDVKTRYPVEPQTVAWYFRELLKIFHSQLTQSHQPLVAEFAASVRRLTDISFETA